MELCHIVLLEARPQAFHVLGVNTEGQVGELFSQSFINPAPAVVVAGSIEADARPFLAHVQAEARVKHLGMLQVGYHEVEVIHGMDAQLARTTGARRQASDLGHCRIPW